MRAIASTLAPPLGALILLLLCAGPVAAEPTEEQKAAIKSNCRSDYMSYCWSVPRGGSEAAQCLKQNLAELSPGCQQAVKAATATAAAPPSAPAAEAKPAAPPAEQAPPSVPAAAAKAVAPAPEPAPQTQSATAKAAAPATPDQGAPPAPAPAAKAAVPAPAAQTPAAETAPAGAAVKAPSATEVDPPAEPPATTAAVPPSSSPPGFIPPGKKLMLVRNCRHDFKVFCPDVDLGGGRAVVCLEDNKAQLTPDCRDALAKVTR